MGFGSYDESEQQQQTSDEEDEVEAVNVHENDHNGKMSFESDVSTDELVSQLGSMKANEEDEE